MPQGPGTAWVSDAAQVAPIRVRADFVGASVRVRRILTDAVAECFVGHGRPNVRSEAH